MPSAIAIMKSASIVSIIAAIFVINVSMGVQVLEQKDYPSVTFSTSMPLSFDSISMCVYEIILQSTPNSEGNKLFFESVPCNEPFELVKKILCDKYGRFNPLFKICVHQISDQTGPPIPLAECPPKSPKTSNNQSLEYFYDAFGIIVILFIIIVIIMLANLCVGDHWKRKRNETVANILLQHQADNQKKMQDIA